MSAIPTSPRSAVLSWCQTHEEIFTDNAAAIGLTAAQALAFKNATEKAVAAALEQEARQSKARSATQDASEALGELRAAIGNAVRNIRTFAENAANPQVVYSTAEIPPPAARTPVPPPAQPTGLRVALDASSGTLTLRWKASNPASGQGTSYIVRRRLAGGSDWAIVGITGAKKFVDATVPAGPDVVMYTVQGQRSDMSGPLSAILTVNFGRAAGGLRAVSVGKVRDGHLAALHNGGGRFVSSGNGHGASHASVGV